jgi:hypothetical protein
MRIIYHTPLSSSVGELFGVKFAMLFGILESGLDVFDQFVDCIDAINQN